MQDNVVELKPNRPVKVCVDCAKAETDGRPMERVQRGGLYFDRHVECPKEEPEAS